MSEALPAFSPFVREFPFYVLELQIRIAKASKIKLLIKAEVQKTWNLRMPFKEWLSFGNVCCVRSGRYAQWVARGYTAGPVVVPVGKKGSLGFLRRAVTVFERRVCFVEFCRKSVRLPYRILSGRSSLPIPVGGPEEPEKAAAIGKNTWSGSKLNEYKIKLSCLPCFDLIEFKYDEQFLGLAATFSS